MNRARRVSELVAVGVAVVAVMALSAGASPSTNVETAGQSSESIALVLPEAPEGFGVLQASVEHIAGAVQNAEYASDFTTQTFVTSERGSDLAELGGEAKWRNFELVLVLGQGASTRRLAPVVKRERSTHFVFLDSSLDELSLAGVPNATAVRFAEEQASYLVGYLSGLMPLLQRPGARADVVSVVGSHPTAGVKRVIRGFVEGVRGSRPGIRVLVDYSHEADDPTRCEAIANAQINAGSDVVFAAAGPCGKGALAVAKLRGVWGAGRVDDGALPRANVLAVTEKEWWELVSWVLEQHRAGTLAAGDVVRGLDDDYAVIIGTNDRVPERLWSRVVEECSKIRRASSSDA